MYKQLISNRSAMTALALALLLASGHVYAQPDRAEHKVTQVTAANQSDIIDSVTTALNEIYVFPEVAQEMSKLVRKNFKKGKYKKITSLAEFTQTLSEDLRSISNDLHLRVAELTPAGYADMIEENPEEQEEIRRQRVDARRRSNFGFKSLEILQGNIGYLDLRGFDDASIGGATAVAAMNFLANSDALIFDLRKNGGGSPSMIQLITSYLLEDQTHINSFYIRREDSIKQFWTSSHVQGPKMADIPVYVLTSARTFSAAEEFTYNLKNLKRATIVGETTGGGAHPIDGHFFRITDEVMIRMSLPFGRAINPISGTNWEGVGVEPDIKVPADQALDVATLEALKKISEGASEDQLTGLQWAITGLDAKLAPVELEEGAEKLFSGTFGPRKIVFENGSLYYQRGAQPKFKLIPMGDDLFGLDGLDYFRIQFVRDSDGSVNTLIGRYDSGRTDSNVRTAS